MVKLVNYGKGAVPSGGWDVALEITEFTFVQKEA
jgi:hypothetical protein